MSDLIDRQAAIDAVNRAATKEVARWSIDELPSAQPERKTGKWTWETVPTIDGLHTYTQVRCSECDERFITDVKYCPNCGAKMKEKSE